MRCFVTATDTNVGKTVLSTLLALRYGASYWKPVQAGNLGSSDSHFVSHYIGKERVFPEAYTLENPMSPNQAAEKEGISIELDSIDLPSVEGSLVVEGAGGIYVPLNEKELVQDMMLKFQLPVILVARSGLGTINHTLLSLSALREKKITVQAVVLVGPLHKENKKTIGEWGKVDVLELPPIEDWSPGAMERTAKTLFFS